MKFVLIQTAAGYVAKVWDETKMVPDPAFARTYTWAAPIQLEGEFEQDYAARLADHHAMIEREAQLLYAAEFAPVEEVTLTEKTIDPFAVPAPIAAASRQVTTKGGSDGKKGATSNSRKRKR